MNITLLAMAIERSAVIERAEKVTSTRPAAR